MKCLECRGACCELIGVHVPAVGGLPRMVEWLRVRGEVEENDAVIDPVFVLLENRCPRLADDGLCEIHDERPEVCVEFPPGCHDCRGSVRLRRTPEDYQRIREAQDPVTIHQECSGK